MKAVPNLPAEFRNDLRFAESIAKRINDYLSGVPNLVLAPANTKVNGKKI